MLEQCKLTLKFEFGTIDDRHMTLLVNFSDGKLFLVTPSAPELTVDIQLPTKIDLVFSGKNYNTDTIVDQTGCIVNDIYVKVCSITLDDFNLNDIFLHQKMKLATDQGQTITTSYIGFNGIVTLDFDQSDVFSQILMLNN